MGRKMEDNKLVQERIRKLNEIREKGINPFPHLFKPTKQSEQIKKEHVGLEAEEQTEIVESIAGRIMLMRNMGKAAFLTLMDDTGRIQTYIRSDDVGKEEYKLLKKLDLGDYIGVTGKVFKTKTGEVTIYAQSFVILTKAIQPLPEKYHGLQDTELKYRKRHLDLIMNRDSKEVFLKRMKIMTAIRKFMAERNFLDTEIPVLQTQYGGGAARPFITHHNELNMDLYLRISPELYLKRLIVGGFERVYNINKNFRNEGIDTTHNPEFTMFECYQAYADYNDMMEIMEDMYDYVAREVLGTTKVMFKGVEVDVAKPWPRVKMLDSIQQHAGIDAGNMTAEQLHEFVKENNIEFTKEFNWGNLVSVIFEEICEEKYIDPTFIIDHPKESTPFCKSVRYGDERLIERFEPFCMGMELGNAYTELNDPLLQRAYLEDQQRQLDAGDGEANPLDEEFLHAIETGMPPTGGLGIGIDRMIMLLTGQESIRDVIFFPTMKPVDD